MRGLARSAAALVVLVVVGGVLGLPPLAFATKPSGEPANPFAYKLTDRPEPGSTSSSTGSVGAASVAPGGFDRSGELPQYTFWSQQLDDRLAIRVNLESGNLIVEQNDLTLKGIGGFDLQITRYWNSLKDGVDSAYGMGWSLGTGGDVGFNNETDGSKVVFGPSGWVLSFAQNPSDPTKWVAPAGVNADMFTISCSCPEDGNIVLRFHQPRVSYVFDPQGVLLWTQDSHGSYTDNGSGNVQDLFYTFPSNHPFYANKITHWPYGQSLTFSADPATSLVTSMQDPLQPTARTWSYGYDSNRHETSYTDPVNHTTHYGYTGDDMTAITDPNGNLTSISYVTYGNEDRVASITRGGFTWSFSYADSASPPTTTLTDPNGHAWTYTADSGGNGEIVKAQDQLGRNEQGQYTANGDVSQTTNAAGGVTTYGYNANNSLVQVQGPAGAGGRQTSSLDYGDSANPYDPSAYHDMTHGGDWQYGYNGSEDLTSKGEGTTPPGQNQVTFSYSNWGEILTAKNALGGQSTYSYTGHNLTGISPPTGSGLGSQSFGYDNIHRLTSSTDGNTKTTSYSYDNLDRVTQETIGTLTFAFGYDNNGNLTSRTDPNGTTTYSYDALNRLTGETKSSGTVGYGYDGAGNLTSVTDAGSTWQYGYDAANRLTSTTEPASPGGRSISYTYTGDTQTKITFPNNATETMTYDAAGQLTEIVGKTAANATVTDFQYGYSGDRRTSVIDAVAGTTTGYGYDGLGRLTSASGPTGYSYSYAYDSDGNMTSKTVNGAPTSYSYNNANLFLTSGFSYDANGNLKCRRHRPRTRR